MPTSRASCPGGKFAIAKALAEGVYLGEIGLMREIALKTVDFMGT